MEKSGRQKDFSIKREKNSQVVLAPDCLIHLIGQRERELCNCTTNASFDNSNEKDSNLYLQIALQQIWFETKLVDVKFMRWTSWANLIKAFSFFLLSLYSVA